MSARDVPLDVLARTPTGSESQAACSFALAHASHQDYLLQSYRLLCAVMHASFVVAYGVLALSAASPALSAAAAMGLAWIHRQGATKLTQMGHHRAMDVDWAQKRVLLLEQQLPPAQRTLTHFKLYQDRKSKPVLDKERGLLADEPAASEVIERYFATHGSASRGKVCAVLDSMRWVGPVCVAPGIAAALTRLLAG
jgi:hypothetical protein